MCRHCEAKRRAAEEARQQIALRNSRVTKAKEKLITFLAVDAIKGSQYIRIKEMIVSADIENLVVAEEILKNITISNEIEGIL